MSGFAVRSSSHPYEKGLFGAALGVLVRTIEVSPDDGMRELGAAGKKIKKKFYKEKKKKKWAKIRQEIDKAF